MDAAGKPQWPALSYERDHETFEALHLMTQIVGKIRLALTPWINHSWHVTLCVTARGLSTSPIPYGSGAFELAFDFLQHRLWLWASSGAEAEMPLKTPTIADFHRRLCNLLAGAGISVAFDGAPNELPEAVPFAEDRRPRRYDGEAAERLWRAWLASYNVFTRFRSGFLGKTSPVHFFWGSFDLAVTRFSGRRAQLHPGGVPHLPDAVVQEAYSHEVASAGFWSGGPDAPFPLFYAYAYPEPAGFRQARGLPEGALFHEGLQEYVLPYDCVREGADPGGVLLRFLQATYEAAADGGNWDRAMLECALGRPGHVRKV